MISSGPVSGNVSCLLPFPTIAVAADNMARGLDNRSARIRAVIMASNRIAIEMKSSAIGGRAPTRSLGKLKCS